MEGIEKEGVEEEEAMDIDGDTTSKSAQLIDLLRGFLSIQQRRAEAYAKLRRRPRDGQVRTIVCEVSVLSPCGDILGDILTVRSFENMLQSKVGFSDYMVSGGELAYQQLSGEITIEFNDCSKQVLEVESRLLNPYFCRDDLANLLKAVQAQEKQKLHLTVQIQLLKKAGRPSERLVSHDRCRFNKPTEHNCIHVHEITEATGTEDAEADAEYDLALKEAIKGVQVAVTSINEHLEEVRYEIEALEAQ